MEKIILNALERSGKLNKVKNEGFIPGVLSGAGIASTSVKFENLALNKIISKHGTNAKVWVQVGDEEKFGFIKELQRHPVDGKIIHVAMQLVSKDQEVKMQLPIAFHGNVELEHKLLHVQILTSEVVVVGKPALIPDVVIVDVSKKEFGENITAIDFNLPPEIKIIDSDNEIYAVIKAIKEAIVEEPEETKTSAE